MNHYRIGVPPKWWCPKLSPWFVRFSASPRALLMRRQQRVSSVTVHNGDVVKQAIAANQGIMIAPNHPSHADPHVIYNAADQIQTPLFLMATWHVFHGKPLTLQWALQKIGTYSVDRDGADMKAFKESVRILQNEKAPLVIFPEGEIYHCNDRVTPFLVGPAMIAAAATRKCDREIVIIPCAIKYQYLTDPKEQLLGAMEELERQVFWRPRTNQSLTERIYSFSEAVLSLKELEFTGRIGTGSLPERVEALSDFILSMHETNRGLEPSTKSIPERIKAIKSRCVKELCDEENPVHSDRQQVLYAELDDTFFVGQLFSYPGDYVAESPTIERVAETIDKFEEDALMKATATIRAQRECHIYFDEPIKIPAKRKGGKSPGEITEQIEHSVQKMLNEHAAQHPAKKIADSRVESLPR